MAGGLNGRVLRDSRWIHWNVRAAAWAKLSDEMRFFSRHFVIASSLSPTVPGADWDFRVNRSFYQSSSAAPQLSRCFGCPKII